MAEKELFRVQVLSIVLEGQLPLKDAASRLGVSYRHARRLKAKLKRAGPPGLAHGNRGRPPANRIPTAFRKRICALAAGEFSGLNDTHFTELLAERENLCLGRETLRSILRQAGIPAKRRRRPKRHHRRRLRSPAKGLMVLWDGSPHHWFGTTQPPCTLMAALEDADGELLGAFFTPQETTEAYLRLLLAILRRHGIPTSIYQDKHSALKRNDPHWSLEEQLAGQQNPTQVGMALRDLGIPPIFANSPQAKGRIERLFGTAQDRLVAEMKLDGITSIPKANAYLKERWRRRFNKRFQTKAVSAKSCFRSPKGLDLKRILSFRYNATVSNDNIVSVGGLKIPVPPGPNLRGFAKARVDVRQHLDGSWSVYYHDKRIAKAKPTPLVEPLRLRAKSKLTKKTPGAHEELLLYAPLPTTTPEDIFAEQLRGQVASA